MMNDGMDDSPMVELATNLPKTQIQENAVIRAEGRQRADRGQWVKKGQGGRRLREGGRG